MNISVEHLPGCKVTLSTEIPADRVQVEREKLIKYFTQRVKVKGFRPGKVPRNLIEKKHGKDINEGIIENLVEETLREAAENNDLQILEVGGARDTKFGADEGLSFVLDVTTVPQFEIPKYEGIAIRAPKLEVKDEQIDSVVADLCKQSAEFADVEGRALQMDDYAVITYSGTIDGVPVAEFAEDLGSYLAGGEDRWMQLQEEAFLPGFCNGLVDAKIGDTVEVLVPLDEDFPIEAVAGQEITYQVEIKGIKEQVIPELTDELANKIEEGLTKESILERIRDNVGAEQARNAHAHKVNEVVRHLNEGLDFDLPESVVLAETQDRVNELAGNAQKQGASEQELMENQEAIIDHAGKQAQFNVRSAFILDKIAEKEGVEVSDQELGMAVSQIAQEQGVPMKKAVREMKKSGALRRVHHDLRIQKTMELVVEKAEIEEVPMDVWEAEIAAERAALEEEGAMATADEVAAVEAEVQAKKAAAEAEAEKSE